MMNGYSLAKVQFRISSYQKRTQLYRFKNNYNFFLLRIIYVFLGNLVNLPDIIIQIILALLSIDVVHLSNKLLIIA